MKNAEIIAKAQQVVDLAKRTGFSKAALQLLDDDDNTFSSVEDYAYACVEDDFYDYNDEAESTLRVVIKLADLTIKISRDPYDEDADPIISYP